MHCNSRSPLPCGGCADITIDFSQIGQSLLLKMLSHEPREA
jgi:hypothetical protein